MQTMNGNEDSTIIVRKIRGVLDSFIEEIIAIRDSLDPDPDLEDGHDREPSLGALDHDSQVRWGDSRMDDREDQNEDGGAVDDEPHDDEGDAEPFLGWGEECSQYAAMQALAVSLMPEEDPNDTDALPLAGSPLDFTGDGRRMAQGLLRQAQCQSPAYWMRRAALRGRP